MRISQKLILGFIGIASLVGIVGATAIKYNTEIVFDVDRILLGNSNEAKAAAEIVYHIQRIKASINELLSEVTDGRAKRKKYAKGAITNSISKLQQFNLLWEDAIKLGIELSKEEKIEELNAFKNLRTKIDGLILLVNKTVALQEEGSTTVRLFFENDVEPVLLETQKIAKDLEENTRKKVITETGRIRNAVKNSTVFSIILSFIGLLAVITIRWFINKSISNPITKLKDAAAEIGKGQLETKIEIKSRDEIGALAQSFNNMACKLKEARTSLEEKVRQRTAELSSANEKLKEEIAGHSSAQRRLQQHIKLRDCLYGLTRVIERPQIPLEQIFQEAVHLIRNAYQQPDVTCVRITFDGIQYKTDNFEKSELSQYAPIEVRGEQAGAIEVYYLGEKAKEGQNPFLKEENDLLDVLARRLGRTAERKKAAETLRLFRDLIDRSNDCIFAMEPKWGRFLDVNDRACASLGYTREELLNMAFKDIEESVPDDSSWQKHTEELKLRGDVIIQGRYRRKDATMFFSETSLKLVKQEKKDYIIAIARDVTERKRAEEHKARLLEEVKSANEELKDFAYVVSHDLKAPLRGVSTLANWLSTDYADKLDEQGREQINLLLGRVERMHNLIDGILAYSRVGHAKEKQVRVNLNELVPEVIDMVAAPQNIKITIENELPVIECGQTRIIQVFQNLLSNAVKYMDKPKGQIKVGCAEQNGFWKFSVADNGRGIEEKHFKKIFKIFQTLSPRDESESTGVGLTVVKKIVELYGGKIWVQSKPGKGSTFFFTLPKQGTSFCDALQNGAEKMGVTDAKLKANIVSGG